MGLEWSYISGVVGVIEWLCKGAQLMGLYANRGDYKCNSGTITMDLWVKMFVSDGIKGVRFALFMGHEV